MSGELLFTGLKVGCVDSDLPTYTFTENLDGHSTPWGFCALKFLHTVENASAHFAWDGGPQQFVYKGVEICLKI